MLDVLILSLVEGGSCGQRTPVLHCADALRGAGASVTTISAGSDSEIDEVIAQLDSPPRPDGLIWPGSSDKIRLVAAVSSDAELRHIIRRLVRRYSPAGSKRPVDLPPGRTLPDLPPTAVLPLAPLQLPFSGTPSAVAASLLNGSVRHFDLLRHDGGSVTLDGVLLGSALDDGSPVPWRGRIEVDDVVLSSGDDPIVAMSIANGSGTATLDGLPLITSADPADGLVDVAIAVPLTVKKRIRYEVRRARGRAVAVTPHTTELPYLDDGVPGELTRKRSWWVEPGAWPVYTPTREA